MVASFIVFGSVLVFLELDLDFGFSGFLDSWFFWIFGLWFFGLLDFGFSGLGLGFCDPSNQSTDITNVLIPLTGYKSTNAVFFVFMNYRFES